MLSMCSKVGNYALAAEGQRAPARCYAGLSWMEPWLHDIGGYGAQG